MLFLEMRWRYYYGIDADSLSSDAGGKAFY